MRLNRIARLIWRLALPILASALAFAWLLAGDSPSNTYAAVPAIWNGCWSGQGNGHAQGHGAAKNKDRDEGEDEAGDRDSHGGHEHRGGAMLPAFRGQDRQIIIGYYRDRGAGLPPGLAKRGGDLPPGLEKQLARNGTLPPGLEKRLEPFPPELERRLPPLPAIYQRGVIGADVVVVNRRTGAILDIIRGAINLSRP